MRVSNFTKRSSGRGFSLVEALIGMSVFAISAVALTQLIIFTRYQSESTLRRQAAETMAYGILEYCVTLTNNELILTPLTVPLSDGTKLTFNGDDYVTASFKLKDSETGSDFILPMKVKLEITDELSNADAPRVEIKVTYLWPKTQNGVDINNEENWEMREFFTARSNIRNLSG